MLQLYFSGVSSELSASLSSSFGVASVVSDSLASLPLVSVSLSLFSGLFSLSSSSLLSLTFSPSSSFASLLLSCSSVSSLNGNSSWHLINASLNFLASVLQY